MRPDIRELRDRETEVLPRHNVHTVFFCRLGRVADFCFIPNRLNRMKATHSIYSYVDSNYRIREILNSPDNDYEEKKSIPPRDQLTFTNGFYVNCSAMFVDIRGSKDLTEKYKRPTLARIYRSYISELVAVFRHHEKVSEINIEGDCVWGVFDTPYKDDIDDLFSVSARVSSMVDILNWRFEKKGYDALQIGIGVDYGRALMLKAGYKTSGINNVIWMGDVVNRASALCSHGNRTWADAETMVSEAFYDNLSEENKKLMEWNHERSCYHGNIINIVMKQWLDDQQSS
jgi:class 3 adenylate cyclase